MLEHILIDNIKALDFVNFQIAELLEIKQKLEETIIQGVNHDHDGAKTYTCGKYKVTVKTDYIYSLDKEEYQAIKTQIPPEFNPVKESVSYLIDKRIIKNAERCAQTDELLLLSKIISKKPSKPNVKVSPLL